MNPEAAEKQIDEFIERRAKGRDTANFEEESWKESVRRHNAKLRRQHRAEWYAFYSRLAAALRASAERYEWQAEALCEERPERSQR